MGIDQGQGAGPGRHGRRRARRSKPSSAVDRNAVHGRPYSTAVHRRNRRALRYRRHHRRAGTAQEVRARIQGLLPLSQREIPVVLGQPREAVLSLLRLRRARHGGRLSHAVREAGISGGGGRSRGARRARNAARGAKRRANRAAPICTRSWGARRASSSRIWRTVSARGDYLQRRGIDGRHRAPDLRWATRPIPGTRCSIALAARRRSGAGCCRLDLIIERDTRGGAVQAGFYDRFRDRLMFPIRDARGRVLGVRRPGDRSRRAEISEFAGNPAVSQGPRTVRIVRGPAGAHAISNG